MQTEYLCPLCRSTITLNDVNVATDIALCRTCGNTSAFSLISGNSEISLQTLSHPPAHLNVVKDMQHGTVLTYHLRSGFLLFLIPFTAFWSGLSMWGIYGSQISSGQFDLGRSLFGLPFLFGTFILLAIITFLLFGHWQITLHKGQGAVFLGVGTLGWLRHFTYNQESIVALRKTTVRINNVAQNGILVQNGASEFIFGSVLTEEAKHYIAATIMQEAKLSPAPSSIF